MIVRPEPEPWIEEHHAGYDFEVVCTKGPTPTSTWVLLARPMDGAWTGEKLERPIALYAGTRVGDWLHRRLVEAAHICLRSCRAVTDPGTRDGAILGFSTGWAEDLAFARQVWEERSAYWTASVQADVP